MSELKDIRVAIATPFYSVSAFSPYITSLVQTCMVLEKAGVKWDFWELAGDSYVFRARNTLAKRLLDSDFTHLFFIDSDEAWTLDSFINVLKADVDVVGGLYPCKNNWEFYGGIIYNDENGVAKVDPETGLIEAWGVPTGFMKINRTVFERLAPHTEEYLVGKDDDGKEMYCHNFFGHIIREKRLYGEDISFNIRCDDIGIKRWVEPRCTMSHYGTKEWKGNFHEYLLRAPGGSKEGK